MKACVRGLSLQLLIRLFFLSDNHLNYVYLSCCSQNPKSMHPYLLCCTMIIIEIHSNLCPLQNYCILGVAAQGTCLKHRITAMHRNEETWLRSMYLNLFSFKVTMQMYTIFICPFPGYFAWLIVWRKLEPANMSYFPRKKKPLFCCFYKHANKVIWLHAINPLMQAIIFCTCCMQIISPLPAGSVKGNSPHSLFTVSYRQIDLPT